jgi:tetratricopeptide (TPR) repeat protein
MRSVTARWFLMLAVAFALTGEGARPAVAAPVDAREMQAREAYAAGRYDKALDLFVKLYAEKLHPNYLWNIGRCYQNLGQPDQAISSFHEYQRKAKNLSSAEQKEVQGYIDEMEALKLRTATPAPPAPSSGEAPAPPPTAPVPAAPEPAAMSGDAVAGGLTTSVPAPREEASPPVYKRWWFWAVLGGVAVAGGLTVFALSRSGGGGSDPVCGTGRTCL